MMISKHLTSIQDQMTFASICKPLVNCKISIELRQDKGLRMRWVSIVSAFCFLLATPVAAEFVAPSDRLGNWTRSIALGRFDAVLAKQEFDAEITRRQAERAAMLGAIYHDVYDGQCAITGPSQEFAQRIDTVTTDAVGRETKRIEGTTQTTVVRQRYTDIFQNGLRILRNSPALVLSRGPQVVVEMSDLAVLSAKVIQRNRCGSPALEQFEENLAALVRGTPSLQARGIVPTMFMQQCQATGVAGLSVKIDKPAAQVCRCLSDHMTEQAPAEWLYPLEDDFSREHLLEVAILDPKIWNGVRACVR